MFKFPAGEVHPKLKLNGDLTKLALFLGENDNLNDLVMEILLSASMNKGKKYFIPYLPYSRQDRLTDDGGPFSLKAFGAMLNLFGLDEVKTLDVHSDVAFACIDNLVNVSIEEILLEFKFDKSHKHSTLVIPDAGAYKKLSKLSMFKNQVIGKKTRDTSTGELVFKGIDGNVKGEDCLVVDDICDGGGTFIALAKELFEAGANSVELFTTHGIYSKGEQVLFDAGIRQLYTTSSFFQKEVPHKTVYDVLRFF